MENLPHKLEQAIKIVLVAASIFAAQALLQLTLDLPSIVNIIISVAFAFFVSFMLHPDRFTRVRTPEEKNKAELVKIARNPDIASTENFDHMNMDKRDWKASKLPVQTATETTVESNPEKTSNSLDATTTSITAAANFLDKITTNIIIALCCNALLFAILLLIAN